jgi:hypothetical protein
LKERRKTSGYQSENQLEQRLVSLLPFGGHRRRIHLPGPLRGSEMTQIRPSAPTTVVVGIRRISLLIVGWHLALAVAFYAGLKML